MDQQMAISFTLKLASLASIISSAEYFAQVKLLKDDGLLSWSVNKLRRRLFLIEPGAVFFNWTLTFPNILLLIVFRIILACLIILGPTQITINPVIVLITALITVLFIFRSPYGLDGADQMLLLIFTGLAIALLFNSPLTKSSFLWFIAIQLGLSYFISGMSKIISQGWRNGIFLIDIMGTQNYGYKSLAYFLNKNQSISKLFSWTVIIWEITFFPIILLLPLSLALPFLLLGILFHMVIAWVMGLNDFLLAFLAPYPALIYCLQVRGW